MKEYMFKCIISFLFLILTGCAARQSPAHIDLSQERWSRYMDTNDSAWKQGADDWFLMGDLDRKRASQPADDNSGGTLVAVTDFNSVIVNGPFKVRIMGGASQNSVSIDGNKEEVARVRVGVNHGVLYLTEGEPPRPANMHEFFNHFSRKNAANNKVNMAAVIVHVNLAHLNNLVYQGSGTLEAIHLHDDELSVKAIGTGNMYLSGQMNLQHVWQSGRGSVNVFGVDSSWLDIYAAGPGSVNLSGHMNLQSIIHHGWGDVHIIGADCESLTIAGDGGGEISVVGQANIKKIMAKGSIAIYLYQVNSSALKVVIKDEAQVGIAGNVTTLHVYTSDYAQFYGRYLCSQQAYAKAQGASHINVTATSKMFAYAAQNSTIYYYGREDILSRFMAPQAMVLIMPEGGINGCIKIHDLTTDERVRKYPYYPYHRQTPMVYSQIFTHPYRG